MSLIHIENLSKHFKFLNRREGLSGAFRFAFTYISQLASWHSTYRNLSSALKMIRLSFTSSQSLALGSLLSPIGSGQKV